LSGEEKSLLLRMTFHSDRHVLGEAKYYRERQNAVTLTTRQLVAAFVLQ